mgnify:FL=1
MATLALTACHRTPDIEVPVSRCADMPSPRASATCFVVADRAYIFGGRDSAGTYLNDLWQYDPASDQWTQYAATTPLDGRVNATACVDADQNIYLGLGFNGRYGADNTYLRDWWRINLTDGQWTRLADYPNHNTDNAVAFAGNGELYVGYGFCWTYARDMFRYDILSDHWDTIDVHVASHGYPPRSFGGCGCTCGGRYFAGTGYKGKSLDWWAEFLPEGKWVECAPVPGQTRTLAAAVATGQYAYVLGGFHYGGIGTNGQLLSDIRRYNPQTDSWQYAGNLPTPLMNHLAFAVGNRVFVGIGETTDEQMCNHLYCIHEE